MGKTQIQSIRKRKSNVPSDRKRQNLSSAYGDTLILNSCPETTCFERPIFALPKGGLTRQVELCNNYLNPCPAEPKYTLPLQTV